MEVKSIVVYLERVELYFTANEIKADKHVPVFLNVIGRENYSLLRNILSPQKPVEQPLKKLMDILREYYKPKKVVMAARFLFHQRQQQPGESVAIYLAELQKLALFCEFGESLDEALQDWLVCGLCNEAYQKQLLSEHKLTLDKALQIAQSMETTDVCRKCHKKGHLVRVGKVNAKTHRLTTATENTEDKVPLLQLGKDHAALITVDVTVNDVQWLPTPAQQCRLCHASNSESYFHKPTYTTEKVAIVGVLPVRVAYKGQDHDLFLVIMQGNGPVLLGREWLAKIRLSWQSIAFHTVVGNRLDEVLQQLKEVICEEPGIARTPSVHLKLKENSQHKFVPVQSRLPLRTQ